MKEQQERERSKAEKRQEQTDKEMADKLQKKTAHNERLKRIEDNKKLASKRAKQAAKMKEFEAAERQNKIEQ